MVPKNILVHSTGADVDKSDNLARGQGATCTPVLRLRRADAATWLDPAVQVWLVGGRGCTEELVWTLRRRAVERRDWLVSTPFIL